MIEAAFTESAAGGIMEATGTGETVCLPLSLSMGDISAPFSDARAEYLQGLIRISGPEFAQIGRELVETARASRERIRTAAESGAPIRVWYSQNPDEFCGFCHLMTLLPESAEIWAAELPVYEAAGDTVYTHSGWGDLEPERMGAYQCRQRLLTAAERRYFAVQWRRVAGENGALRALVNGRLCTVGADFYDPLILAELDRAGERFQEARLIGDVLGRHPLGFSDWLVAGRIEEFISRGILEAETKPQENRPVYHRILRKRKDERHDI